MSEPGVSEMGSYDGERRGFVFRSVIRGRWVIREAREAQEGTRASSAHPCVDLGTMPGSVPKTARRSVVIFPRASDPDFPRGPSRERRRGRVTRGRARFPLGVGMGWCIADTLAAHWRGMAWRMPCIC